MFILKFVFMFAFCYLVIQGMSLGCIAIAHNNKRRREDEEFFKRLDCEVMPEVEKLERAEYKASKCRAYRNECR